MKNFFNRTAALLALFCYFPSAVCASEWAAGVAAGRRTLGLYLERAKIQTDQSRFEKIAGEGISAALFEWERGCEDFGLCDSAQWKAQRACFERELGEAADEAFCEWLLERKEENSFAAKKVALYGELQKAAAGFFVQDEDGSQSRAAGAEKIQEAKERWKALAEKIVEKYLNENFSDEENADLRFAEQKVSDALMNEFLYDQNSLKKQSELRSALFVADSLASRIEVESERAVSELFNSLEKEAESASADEVFFQGGQRENWLSQFESELRRGLEKWEEAEDDFLAARAQWEMEAEGLYESESVKWQEAWNELLERKESWGKKIAAQFQESERVWQKKFSGLEEEISNYLQNFQDSLALEFEQKNWIVQTQVQSYEHCRSILKAAKDGIENWGAAWADKYKGLYSYWKSEDSEFWENFSERFDSTRDLKIAIQNWKRDFALSVKDLYSAARGKMEDLSSSNKKYYKLYYSTLEEFSERESQINLCSENSSAEEIAEACAWLCSRKENIEEFLGDDGETYLQTLSNAAALWNADSELLEWLDLFDKFSAMSQGLLNSFSESVNLSASASSELSVKWESVSALLESLEERVQIAQAVYDYAQNKYSDVESAAQSEEKLRRSLYSLEEANAEYERLCNEARVMEADLEKSRENYLSLLDESSAAAKRLEEAREKFREMCLSRNSLYSPMSTHPAIFDLIGRLETWGGSSSGDFEKMLFAFAQKIQEPEKQSFLERVQEMKSALVDGLDGISCDSSKIEGLALSEEFESAKKSLAGLDGSLGKTLSMSRLFELYDGLEEILSGGAVKKDDVLSLMDDLKILDAACAEELNEKLGSWPGASGAGGGASGSGNSGGGSNAGGSSSGLESEIRDCLKSLLERCDGDLKNREAALLLLEGSAEEIHEFFDGGAFSQVYENYSEYSEALLEERQKAARERVANVIDGGIANLFERLEALDHAAEGLDAAGKAVLELYKEALKRQSKYMGKDSLLNMQLREMFNFSTYIKPIDWRILSFEKYFCEESGGADSSSYDGFDEDFFYENLSGPAEALDKLEHYIECERNPAEISRQLEAAILEQDAVVKAAQAASERAMLAAVDDSPESALAQYSSALGQYNEMLGKCFEAWKKAKAVRLDYRLAEEIYFYGQNEYLRGSYDAEKKLLEAVQKRDCAKAALDALNAVERSLRTEGLLEYEQSLVQSVRMRALAYKHQKSMAAQSDALALAQAQERAAVERIVVEASAASASFKVPAAARDLVSVVYENDGSRSVRLDGDANLDGKNEERLLAYYTDLLACETDANKTERRYSFARQDAIRFLESLEDKPYSLTDLALAALCVEAGGDFWSREQWFKNGEDPQIDDFFKIGDLPDQVHGVDLARSFRVGRMETIKDAFLRVAEAGGEDDIARYILYSSVNFSPNLGAEKMQKNALVAAALNEPIGEAKSSGSSWIAAADALYVSVAALGVIAAMPFVGSWAVAIVAALAPFAESFASTGKKLFETAADISQIQLGCVENLKEELKNYDDFFAALNEARENLKMESERFSSLNGNGGGERRPISWNEFSESLSKTFQSEKDPGYSACLERVLAAANGQEALKEFFERLSNGSPFYSVSEALEKMLSVLNDKEFQEKRALNSYLTARSDDLSFDEDAFLANLLSFYSSDLIKNLPMNLGDDMEDYQAEVFSDALELRERLLSASVSKKLEEKKAVFSVIYDDLAREYSDWKEKCELILQTADIEWKRAAERIQSGFSAWQAQWGSLYKSADEEWSENYSGFLLDKQNWIYSQYIRSPAVGASGEWAAKAKKAADALLLDKAPIDALVSQFFDSRKFERLCGLSENLAAYSKNNSIAQSLFLMERRDSSIMRDIAVLTKASRDLQEETQKAAAKCALQTLQRKAGEALESYLARVDEQNKAFERWELELVRSSGYVADPLIHRSAVVGSTLFETKRETQWVHRYEWYSPEKPNLNLDPSPLTGDSQAIMTKAEDIERTLKKWTDKIFGTEDSPSGGDFNRHIGSAPVFVEKPNAQAPLDRNVESWGSGQLGLIMLDYQWNSIRNSEGYAELSKAVYDQQLFDTGIDGLTLPTIRDAASVICDIVSTYPPLYFVKYVDDTIFSAFDLGMGYKPWEEVLNETLRQGLVGAVSYGVGAVMKSVGEAVQKAYGVLEKSAVSHVLNAAKGATAGYFTSGVSGTLKAIDFVRGEIDWKEASDAWLSSSALTGVAGAMLGGVLNAGLMVDANGNALNESLFANAYKATAAFGSLSGAALNYILTGDFSVNLANIRGVGFLEIGVKDGQFYGGYGRDGVDLSFQTLSSLVSSSKELSKINGMRLGSEEERSLLAVENQLAWSGRSANYNLAKALFDGKMNLSFEEGAGNGKFVKDGFVMDSALLEQGKEGAALLATLLALQNSAINGGLSIDQSGLSTLLKKEDGSSYSEEEIRGALDKLKNDANLSGLVDAGAAAFVSRQMLGLAGKSQNGFLNDFAALGDAYNENGLAGAYILYSTAAKRLEADGKSVSGLAQLLEQPFFQNEETNRGAVLGFSLAKDEYNEIARQNAIDRFVDEKVENARKDGASSARLLEIERETRAAAESEIVLGVKNEKYGYNPENKASDLYSYGCTLATAAYVAYSITGKIVTLNEANEILKSNGLYNSAKDNNGVSEKNLLYAGDSYAAAVNAIAGADCLQADGSIEAVKNGVDNRQSIYNGIKSRADDASNIYFTNLRVNGKHSVLLDSIDFSDGGDYKTSTFTVMDPWAGGTYGPKNGWADITRSDFYKLTQSGRDLYNLTRSVLRAAASQGYS